MLGFHSGLYVYRACTIAFITLQSALSAYHAVAIHWVAHCAVSLCQPQTQPLVQAAHLFGCRGSQCKVIRALRPSLLRMSADEVLSYMSSKLSLAQRHAMPLFCGAPTGGSLCPDRKLMAHCDVWVPM